MRISTRTALEVASHEGMVRQAYKDSVGVWTWSVGITSKSGHSVERYIANPQSLKKCLEVWLWVLERYAEDVRKALAGRPITEAQFAAALSFHWNTGAIHKASWVKHWKAGDEAKARKAFMNWKKPKEIIPRRRAERDLFFEGKWTNKGHMIEYTRLTERNTPDWGSGTRIDVSGAISAILGGPTGEYPTQPKPDVEPTPPKPSGGLLRALLRLLGLAR